MNRIRRWSRGALAAILVAIAIYVWSPWISEHDREVSWLRSYEVWWTSVDRAIESGNLEAIRTCDQEDLLAEAPTPRMRAAAAVALAGCDRLRRPLAATGGLNPAATEQWVGALRQVILDTTNTLGRLSEARPDRQLAELGEPFAARPIEVLCWNDQAWADLEEEGRALGIVSVRLNGLADSGRGRIHLSPRICEPLLRVIRGEARLPFANGKTYADVETFLLVRALITLLHEAGHVRRPAATEEEVECTARGQVGELVLALGGSRSDAATLTHLAAFESSGPGGECRNGVPFEPRDRPSP
jgi:hypothetical protein